MSDIELSDKVLKGYLAARSFTRAIGNEIVSKIKVGMTEKEVEELASGIFKKNGVKQHWHMPVIGVGEGSTKLQSLASYAHDVSIKIAEHVNEEMIVADVFYWAQELIGKNPDYTLAYPPFVSMGHRLCKIPPLWQKLPEAGLNYLLFKTRGPFIKSGNNTMMNGLWTIEPYIMYKERAAKFEELVFIGKETVILETS